MHGKKHHSIPYLFRAAHLLEHGYGRPKCSRADAGLRADGAEDGRDRRKGERHDAAGARRHLQDPAADARQAAPPLEPIQLRIMYGRGTLRVLLTIYCTKCSTEFV